MSFSQLLTLIEVRNERERRAYEAAEAAAQRDQSGEAAYTQPPKPKDLSKTENLPNVSEIQRLFGGGGMVG